MPSFSALLTTVIAISASALAYTTPTTFNQTTNPIYTPNSGDIVPVGKAYKITWEPTSSGTVSIILLRGPAENILPLYPIAEEIANSGSYTWTPKTDLEDDTSEYGLQIIIDSNGQYQYSTQFGVSNPNYVASSSSTTASGYETAEPTTTSYSTVDVTTKSSVTSLITITTAKNTTYTPTYAPPSQNSTATYVAPTATEEPTEEPEATDSSAPAAPSPTGAAASIKVASGLLFGVAGVAALLL